MTGFLTQVGLAKVNVSSPLQPVTIKSMAIGAGTGAYSDSILSLQDQRWIGDATAPIQKNGGLEFSASMPSSVGGFNITEIGLIDKDGDLIAYERLDSPINKPIGLMKLTPYMLLILNNSAKLNVIITDEVNFRHNGTNGRDVADCHPMSSITGLQDALSNRVLLNESQTIGGNKRFEYDTAFKQIVSWWEGAVITFGNKWMKLWANSGTSASTEASIHLNGEVGEVTVVGKIIGDSSNLSAATTTKKGVVQLNNTLTSTSTSEAATANTVKLLNDRAFGVGQSWKDVTSTRVSGTTYTNTTGKTIFICITAAQASGNAYLTVRVDDVTLGDNLFYDTSASAAALSISFPVNPGGTYYYSQTAVGSSITIAEYS